MMALVDQMINSKEIEDTECESTLFVTSEDNSEISPLKKMKTIQKIVTFRWWRRWKWGGIWWSRIKKIKNEINNDDLVHCEKQ